MRSFLWIIFFVFLIASYYLFYSLFTLLAFLFIMYIFIKIIFFVQKMRIPKGKRIKHKLLKGFLKQKYGSEGKSVYKEAVKELNKEGYK